MIGMIEYLRLLKDGVRHMAHAGDDCVGGNITDYRLTMIMPTTHE